MSPHPAPGFNRISSGDRLVDPTMLAVGLVSAARDIGCDERLLHEEIPQVFDQSHLNSIAGRFGKTHVKRRVQVNPQTSVACDFELLDEDGEAIHVLGQATTSSLPHARNLEIAANLVQLFVRVTPEKQKFRPACGHKSSIARARAQHPGSTKRTERLTNHRSADSEGARKLNFGRQLFSHGELAGLDQLDESAANLLRGAHPSDLAVPHGHLSYNLSTLQVHFNCLINPPAASAEPGSSATP
jgi:hypothetical protein